MFYKVVHQIPGRIRIQCGRYTFTEQTAGAMQLILRKMKGIKRAEISAITGSLVIHYESIITETQVLATVRKMNITELEKETVPIPYKNQSESFFLALSKKVIYRYGVSPLLFTPIRNVLSLWGTLRFFKKAYQQLFIKKKLSVEVLDAAAIGVSLQQKSISGASSIIFLLTVSELIEQWCESKSKASLAESLALTIDKVWVVSQDTEVLLPLMQVHPGDIVVVRTGSLIPVDGTIVKGEAMVNQSTMTGEPLPVQRDIGKTVFAGTYVEEGSIYIEVTSAHQDSRLNRIIHMVDDAEQYKSAWQSKTERMADSIVPYSFIGFFVAALLTGSIRKASTILLVDYSCAIKLSTSLSVLSALNESANHNVIIKGGKYLEAIAHADTIVLDKTGTLTEASPEVSHVVAFGDNDRAEVLKIAACLEEHFPHSVARAVVQKALDEDLAHQEEHTEVEYIIAHGIASMWKGRRVLIGSEHFIFEDEKVTISPEDHEFIHAHESNDSVLYLAIDGVCVGALFIHDPVKKDAFDFIQSLREAGFEKIVMLTGDSRKNAEAVATELDIDEWCAQMLPEDKAAYIQKLKDEGHQVMMVGDGVNDTPALSAANVGIAMESGSDIAREVADVALYSSQLTDLVAIKKISNRVLAKTKSNYHFILSFNTSLLALGLMQILTPQNSALLHNLSTIGVGIHSLKPLLPKK